MRGINIPPVVEGVTSVDAGMNNWDAPWSIDQNFAVRLENIELDKRGLHSRRRGAATIGAGTGSTDPLAPRGLFPFYDNPLGQGVLYGVYDDKAYILNGGYVLSMVASGASFTSTLHNGQRGYWNGVDTVYIHTDGKNYSNISEASLLTAVDVNRNYSQCASMAPRCAAWWQFRLWCGINTKTGDDQTLWWSELNDGLSYSAYNTIRVEPGRGGSITGLVPIRSGVPQMLIFKERLIAVLTTYWGSSSALIPSAADALDVVQSSVRVVTDSFGAVSGGTIQYVPGARVGEVVFLAHDGFRAMTRASDDTLSGASLPISEKIRTTIARINFTHVHKASSVVWDAKYHVALPLDGATENTHILTLDLITGAWYLNTWKAAALTNTPLTQIRDQMWFQSNAVYTDSVSSGLATGYHVYRAFNGTYDPGGAPPPWVEETKAFTLGGLRNRKKFSWFGLMGYNGGATCVIQVEAAYNNLPYTNVTNVVIAPGDSVSVILGSTPLPWTGTDPPLFFQKLGLEDLAPAYTLQLRLSGTGPSDYSRPTIVLMEVGGRVIDPEFSNEIT